MRIWLGIFLALGLLVSPTWGQLGNIPQHGASLEILGPGIPFSFNYEFFFNRNPFVRMSARIGANVFRAGADSLQPKGSVFPISTNFIFFKGKHHFELDLGAMAYVFYQPTSDPQERSGIFPMISPGYRFMPEKQGIFFKLSLTPWYFPQPVAKDQFTYWPGLAIGYGF